MRGAKRWSLANLLVTSSVLKVLVNSYTFQQRAACKLRTHFAFTPMLVHVQMVSAKLCRSVTLGFLSLPLALTVCLTLIEGCK